MTNKVVVNSTNNTVVTTTQVNKVVVAAKGARGAAGTNGGASFIQGIIPPTNTIGNNGDTYLNTNTSIIYEKVSGVWINPTSIIAPAAISFRYEKQSPANIWNITHNLGFRPSANVMDYGQNNVECDIEHINENSLKLTFSEVISGYAYLS